MKIWTWFKSLSWIAIAGAIGGAIYMVLNAYRAGQMEIEVEHDETRIKELEQGAASNEDVKKAKAFLKAMRHSRSD